MSDEESRRRDGSPRGDDTVDDSHPDPDESDPPDGSGDVSVSWVERAVMFVALAFTVALFSFAVWQSFAGATAVPPTANVTDVEPGDENATYYVVTLRNRGDVGLVTATVGVDCPSPSRSVTFENVPARAHRNATVGCPPGGDPSAAVTSWIPE